MVRLATCWISSASARAVATRSGSRDRSQTDKLNARREPVRNRGGYSNRQTRFSGASRTGEAQQPNVRPEQQLGGFRHLLFSSDERSARDWQIVALPGNLRRGQLTAIRQVKGISCREMIWLRRALDHLGSEQVPAPRHSLEQLLAAIIQCATQLEGTLHQRIVGNEGIGPHRLHQFLLADQPSRVFHQVLEGFIDLGAKLDLLSRLEHTPPCDVQRELAELIVQGTRLQVCSRFRKARQLVRPDFRLFFGVVSLLLVLMLVTLHLLGEAQHSVARSSRATGRRRSTERILAKCGCREAVGNSATKMSTDPQKEISPMSTTQIPTIDMKVRQFATQFQYSMIALVLMSVCPLRALAQDGHSHTPTAQQTN